VIAFKNAPRYATQRTFMPSSEQSYAHALPLASHSGIIISSQRQSNGHWFFAQYTPLNSYNCFCTTPSILSRSVFKYIDVYHFICPPVCAATCNCYVPFCHCTQVKDYLARVGNMCFCNFRRHQDGRAGL
jgi:hypothetical protein